jgi:hypothetical protein
MLTIRSRTLSAIATGERPIQRAGIVDSATRSRMHECRAPSSLGRCVNGSGNLGPEMRGVS